MLTRGKAQRRKPGENNTNRQREEHRKTQENLKDTVGQHKTQQDMIQRHGHQIQADTRQKKHNLSITQRTRIYSHDNLFNLLPRYGLKGTFLKWIELLLATLQHV